MGDVQRVPTTDGLRLAVHTHGDPTAPTVLCVHGYPDNSAVWDGVVEQLRERFHVVTYDVRGAGRSPAPPERPGYRLDQLAVDLARVAATVSPDEPVHLLAHDWGSIQAWHAVTDDALAGYFASLTSISGPCLDHVAHWMRSDPAGGRRQSLHSTYIRFFQLPVLPEISWLSGIGTLTVAGLDRLTGPGSAPEGRQLRDYLNGLELYRANVADRMSSPQERRTDVPAQVLLPTREVFMVEEAQTAAGHWATDFRVHRVAGGHWVPRSHPEVVARHVASFVAEVSG